MDWKNRFTQISNKVRAQLFAKKVENLAWLQHCIKDFDPAVTAKMTAHNFNLFLNKVGIFLTTQELRTIKDKFDYDSDDNIHYVGFIDEIRTDISQRVLESIKSAFQFLDYKKQGSLDIKDLLTRYHAEQHPHNLTRRKCAENIIQEFQTGLQLKSANQKTITEREFLEYYADLNFCVPVEREDWFIELIMKTWGMTFGKDYVSHKRVQEIEDILYEKVRQKTEEKSSEGKAAKAAFKYFDLEDSGKSDIAQFTNALDKFGCKFSPAEIKTLFSKYDTDGSGCINIDEFCQMFSSIGANGPNRTINPLTTLGKNSIGFNQLKLSK